MLRILAGPAGAGKTAYILREMTRPQAGEKRLLIVPEQYSHQAERALCAAGGDSVSLYAEVFSFTGLRRRVFSLAGGAAQKRIDASGRLLIMCRALDRLKSELKVYAAAGSRPELLSALLACVDEFTACGATGEKLYELSESVDFSEKLRELALILETYRSLTAATGLDPSDALTRAAERLEECDFGEGAEIYIDSFTDFTAPEREIIDILLKRAASVTVALTCDSPHSGAPAFDVVRRTAAGLMRDARRLGVPCEIRYANEQTERPETLKCLAESFFDAGAESVRGGGVTITETESFYDECRAAASSILALVRGGCRFNEIGIAVRDLESRRGVLESVMAQFGVPLYTGGASDILSKPVPAFVISALETVSGGFEYEDMFRYLKTGLTDVTADERDRLENYVLKWNIRGSMWYRDEPWSFNPEGFDVEFSDASRAALQRINALRERVRAPLCRLRDAQSTAKTAGERVRALYSFLLDAKLPERIDERVEHFRASNRLKDAEEYGQLWEIIVSLLDQFYDVLCDVAMDRAAFTRLFSLALGCCDVGSIPVSIDCVTALDVKNMGHGSLKHLFLLGANDSVMPLITGAGGAISDNERETLRALGLELLSGDRERLGRELGAIYAALTEPKESLNISYSRATEQGEPLRPAFIVARIRELLPDTEFKVLYAPVFAESSATCFEAAAEALGGSRDENAAAALTLLRRNERSAARLERLSALIAGNSDRLSREAVRGLYGGRFGMSASRIDKFYSCRFQYFVQYGLKAKPRKSAGFEAPEMGTFVHYVLENVIRAAAESGGMAALDDAAIRELVKRYVNQYIQRVLNGFKDKTPRFEYLFSRLTGDVTAIVLNMAQELRVSQFTPMEFELQFGGDGPLPPVVRVSGEGELSVSGFVDRVDGWEKDGRLYLRVVDYKTGRKSFDLTDVLNGIGLQMMIYLFALSESGGERYGRDIVPAGVLYVPARDPIVQGSRGMEERERLKKVAYELRRRGVVLDDADVVMAMENSPDGEMHFLPVKLDKNGGISGSALLSAEKLGKLSRHVDALLLRLTDELAKGSIETAPYERGGYKSCDHCEFASVCHFSDGGVFRRMETVKDAEFWAALDGEAEK